MSPKITYILLLLLPCSLWGQKQLIQTLKKQSRSNETPTRIKALNQLTLIYYDKDMDKAEQHNAKALELLANDSTSQQASSTYANLALLSYCQGQLEDGLRFAIKAIRIAQPLQDSTLLARAYTYLGLVYSAKGYAHKALDYIIQALKITEKGQQTDLQIEAYHTMAKAYLNLDNPQQAYRFLQKTIELKDKYNVRISPIVYLDMGASRIMYDSIQSAQENILHGLDLCRKAGNIRGLAFGNRLLGNISLLDLQVDEAKAFFEDAQRYYKKLHDKIGQAQVYSAFAQLYFNQQKYKQATKAIQQAIQMAKTARAKSLLKFLYKDMSDIEAAAGNYLSALQNYRRYTVVKDSIFNRDKNREIAELQIKHQANVLKREKKELVEKTRNQALEIALRNKEISIQELRNNQNFYIFVGLGGLLLLALIIGALIVRQDKLKAKIRETDLEQRALRSQMNPHFMFNSLNSIQSLIATGDNSAASIYLAKFARLMRRILKNSRATFIPLQDELDFLQNYIELEQRRFKEAFDFEIDADAVEDAHYSMIPPLVIQPFIENAIIHGLLRKKEKGKLRVVFENYNNLFVKCLVIDNGIGRAAAAQFKEEGKHDSLGIKITEQRLTYLALKQRKAHKLIEIIDLKDDKGKAIGTEVHLLLPIKYKKLSYAKNSNR